MAEANKIDSNVSTLRIAEEESLKTLPSSPSWYNMEPNSYSDFGGSVTLVARNPISADRQRKKGVITDLDASGGFNQDLTFTNLSALWPGIFMSTKIEQYREEGTDVTGITNSNSTFAVTNDPTSDIQVDSLVYVTGAANSDNNGLFVVTAVTASTIVVNGTLVDETPTSDLVLRHVGHAIPTADGDVTATSGSLPTITVTDDLTANLAPGDFIFIGDGTNQYANDENNGFARIYSIDATTITLDKTSGGADGETEMTTEDASSLVIYIFFGDKITNVGYEDSNFDRRTYTLERSLGVANPESAPSVIQSELLTGAVINEFSLNVASADKITTDWTFIAADNEQRDGVTSGEERLSTTTGSIVDVEEATAYNTSSDFTRIKLSKVRPSDGGVDNLAAPEPLFAYVTDLTLNISNGAVPNKAVSVLGAFDITAGVFTVGGSITAYFADVEAVKSVRNNDDITLDIAIVKDFGSGESQRKAGIVIDVPLIALGDGRSAVTQDEAITLPLDTEAAQDDVFDYTLSLTEFYYLPDTADT